MKSVLITGSSGCIGEACVRYFAQRGWRVIATSRSPVAQKIDGVEYHCADLAIPGVPSKIIDQFKPSFLLHVAWHMSAGNWQNGGDDKFLQWVGISTELVQAFRSAGGEKAVCMGSATEYDWGLGVLHEDSARNPSSMYGLTKSCTGDLLVEYAKRVDLPFVWARLFFMYGGREAENRLVPSVIRSLLRGQKAETSDGMQVRDFLYVDDVACALYELMVSDVTGAVNVGSGCGVSLRTIIELIGETIGRSDLLRLGARPQAVGDAAQVIADTSRLRQVGFEPKYDLESGVRESVDFWRNVVSKQ